VIRVGDEGNLGVGMTRLLEQAIESVAGPRGERLHRDPPALAGDGDGAVAALLADIGDGELGHLGGAQPVEEEEADEQLVPGPGVLRRLEEKRCLLAADSALRRGADRRPLDPEGGDLADGAGVDGFEVEALDRGQPTAGGPGLDALALEGEHPELDRGAVDLEEPHLPLLAPLAEGHHVAAVLGGGGGPVVEQEPAEDAELLRGPGGRGRQGGELEDLGDRLG
jgi:hypothetical protein